MSDMKPLGYVRGDEQDAPQLCETIEEELLMAAWGLIANASGGDWTKESPEWQDAAARWRNEYIRLIRSHSATE